MSVLDKVLWNFNWGLKKQLNQESRETASSNEDMQRAESNLARADLRTMYDDRDYHTYIERCYLWSTIEPIQKVISAMCQNASSTTITLEKDDTLLENFTTPSEKKKYNDRYLAPLNNIYNTGSELASIVEKFIIYYITYGECGILIQYHNGNSNTSSRAYSFDIIDPQCITGLYYPPNYTRTFVPDMYYSALEVFPFRTSSQKNDLTMIERNISRVYIRKPSYAQTEKVYNGSKTNSLGYYTGIQSDLYERNTSLESQDDPAKIVERIDNKASVTEYLYHFKSRQTPRHHLRGLSPLLSVEPMIKQFDRVYHAMLQQATRSQRADTIMLAMGNINKSGSVNKDTSEKEMQDFADAIRNGAPITSAPSSLHLPKDVPTEVKTGANATLINTLASLKTNLIYDIADLLGVPRKMLSDKGSAFNNMTIARDLFNMNTMNPLRLLVSTLNNLHCSIMEDFYNEHHNNKLRFAIDITSSTIAIQQIKEVNKSLTDSNAITQNEARDNFGLAKVQSPGANELPPVGSSASSSKSTEELLLSKKSTNQSGEKVRQNASNSN